MPRLIVKIRDIGERLARAGTRDPLYDVPYSTSHTGVVHGGTALNIVPDACTFEFEFRQLATDDVGKLVDEVTAYARDELEPQMRAVDPATRIVFEERSEFPGLETPPSDDIVGFAKRLAGRNEHGKVAYGTEAGLFARAGIPTVVIGPGSIEQAHKADEYIAVSQLEACGAFIDQLIAYSRA
jgi:acetylornithine deacetylase